MKAVLITAAGGPEVLKFQDIADPVPGEAELLIRLKAAGVNPVDTKLRPRGTYYPDRLPAVLGCDGAGIVEKVGGSVKGFKEGDEVYFCYGGLGADQGNYAQYNVVNERSVTLKPSSIPFIEAAAAPLVLLTAWEALHDRARIQEGYKVLVHGGAGGVGHVAIQLAKAAGCTVAATVSSSEKADFVKGLGADEAINYKEVDFVQAATEWSGGNGVDVVMDTVGGKTYTDSFRAVKFYGDVVTIVGTVDAVDWGEAKKRNLRMSVEYMLTPMIEGLNQSLEHQASILKKCATLFDAGKLKIHVGKTFPLEKAGEAHKAVEQVSTMGKVVLEID